MRYRLGRTSVVLGGVLALGMALPRIGYAQGQDSLASFDHARHRKLFPTCTTCHAAVVEAGQPLFPAAAECATCHDGTVQKRVTYQPPAEATPSNLRFDHLRHRDKVLAKPVVAGQEAKAPPCEECHSQATDSFMTVKPPIPSRCFQCHGIEAQHTAAPDTACATCHLPLPAATRLTRADVAAFDTAPSHLDKTFASAAGHGTLAKGAGGTGVSASCATCHARDFCITCHVDAPEQPAIQALAADPRSTAIPAHLRAPASHSRDDFLERHGGDVGSDGKRCSTCHTRESCLACHAATPRVATALYAGGPGRGVGAVVTRKAPPWHAADYTDRHAVRAASAPNTCAGCHARAECLECHRPNPASAPGYHPVGFLTRHPAAAYSRENSCSDCHNTAGFCVTCHASVGLTSRATLGANHYHDAQPSFALGHGQAARQSLETCIGCHVEKDCLTCHSAAGGRRFNPHGPGFDAQRLKSKNPQMCSACHGSNIP